MPTNYRGRITLILVLIVLALICIFPHPSYIFDANRSAIQRTSIRPGIDMVGGVSLIYQVQGTGGAVTQQVLEQTMDSLKRRVDPNGVRNLVWRPQPPDQLEIQMPITPGASNAPMIKQAYTQIQEKLDANNISQTAVISAVEKLQGDARAQKLTQLAAGSSARKKLFDDLAATFDQITKLKSDFEKLGAGNDLAKAQLTAQLVPLNDHYADLTKQIEDTNINSHELETILDEAQGLVQGSEVTDAEARRQAAINKVEGEKKLAELKLKFADFPPLLATIDEFQKRYDEYQTVKSAISDASDLKALLRGSGVLEFHILADSVTADPQDIQVMDERLKPGGRGPLPQPGDKMRWALVDRPTEFRGNELRTWNGKNYILLLATPESEMIHRPGDEEWGLASANAGRGQWGDNVVEFKFDTVGGRLFGKLTDYWAGRAKAAGAESRARLAIVLDNKVISAPNINEPILGGSGQISGGGRGGFSEKDLNYLVNTLNAGSLPAQLTAEPISEQDVEATIGKDNLTKGLVACGFGLVVVGVFLVSYYYVAGIVAFVAVCMNLVIILGTLAALGATFTLPSIAGVVLTVGTAVDANVLIFERLREEQHRGLPLRMALKISYDRAFSAIIDSNMTSAITSMFLYMFGSEEVKGFGLTLLIGIGASLFTALFVTKTIFGIMIDKFGMRHLGSLPLTFPKWDKMLKPNWDWMGKAWMFYTFSIVAIVTGTTLFLIKTSQGKMMDIEFASGTDVQFLLHKPTSQDDVRKLIEIESRKRPDTFAGPSVLAVRSEGDKGELHIRYEVVVPSAGKEASSADTRKQVEEAVIEALGDRLKIERPSTFAQFDAKYIDAKNKTVLPIKDVYFNVPGVDTPSAKEHPGGVAIVLHNLSPAMSVKDIRGRLTTQKASASYSGPTSLSYEVEPAARGDIPVTDAVVIAWDPSVDYERDPAKWEDTLAVPAWNLVTTAINKQATMERETSFNPQVAGQMRNDAMLALTFSIAAIMVYIWIRFGNLKYGTATVIALIHDTIFTIAAIGFAHYITDYWKDNFLQLTPFRINLTVVAGILTIMGYSMIDTIVVFDRIREKRGEYGHLDRDVINKAINETLSRTLLTCGTSIITVSFMYFLGGEGIHGFTFVLLIGILVGTYSSVAIAAPLLLLGQEKQTAGVRRGRVGQPALPAA